MSREDEDHAPDFALWDETEESSIAYLAAASDVFSEWNDEADCAAFDDL